MSAQHPLTLDDAVAVALRQSPDLLAARARAGQARADVHVARSYPNPTFAVTPGNPFQYSAQAPLDVGPQRTLRVRTARLTGAATQYDVADTERRTRFAVRAAFVDLLLADSLLVLKQEERRIFADLLTADSVRLRAGDIPVRDVTKSEIELARADADLLRAHADDRAARLQLQSVMGISQPDTTFAIQGSLAVRGVPMLDRAGSDSATMGRPDVVATSYRTMAGRDAVRLVRAQMLPLPLLTLAWQPAEPFPTGHHYALGVGVLLPVWNWSAGEREHAAAALAEAEANEEHARLLARTDVTIAVDRFRAAVAVTRRFDDALLAKALRSLEDARYAYTRGAISYVELLDAIRTYGDVRADALTAAHDYWVSVYAVMSAVNLEPSP